MSTPDAVAITRKATENVILKVCGLNLGYRGRRVLTGVDLAVRQGDFWFFVGPNGAGKSTLVRAIFGNLRPFCGKIDLDRGVAKERKMGFVPQRCDLKSTLPMTVFDFVILGLVGKPVSRREARDSTGWALTQMGLERFAHRDYWALSGGQRQRALVARGLVRRPRLLILDEPIMGLDLAAEAFLLQQIASLNKEQGVTVIFVTHNISTAAHYATHIALFRGGRVISGRPETVLTHGNLMDAYGADVKLVQDSGKFPWVQVQPTSSSLSEGMKGGEE
jgi:ABC-type Mn2+/Zn2+ transport system ATPase subunit